MAGGEVALGAVGQEAGRGKAVLLALLPAHQTSDAAGAGSLVLSACRSTPGRLPQLSEVYRLRFVYRSHTRTFCNASCRLQRMGTSI